MFPAAISSGPRPKAIVSVDRPHNYISRNEPPTKTEPFKTVLDISSGHQLSLLIADTDLCLTAKKILQEHGQLHYCKVFMKLLDVVSGDFFNEYIKTNDICMRSEGRAGIDNLYTLEDGVLRLEIDKPTFERLGLEGTAIPSHGRKHVKARYAVELNLRLPAMVRGKKGFERVLRAFAEILNDTKAWLFYNVKSPGDFTGSVAAFQPVVKTIIPSFERIDNVQTPEFLGCTYADDHEAYLEIVEWIGMLMLGSERVKKGDKIDSYLSRYAPPAARSTDASTHEDHSVSLNHWQGFIHAHFVRGVLIELLEEHRRIPWFALTMHAFDNRSYTILKTDQEIIVSTFYD